MGVNAAVQTLPGKCNTTKYNSTKLARPSNLTPLVQLMVTVFGLFVGGYIIISGAYSPGTETTAGGIVGIIFGYWSK